MRALQGSLLDVGDELIVRPVAAGVRRTPLAEGAWVDQRLGWLGGADTLFDCLYAAVPWQAEQRQMYDTIVDVPRLTAFYQAGEALPHPILDVCRDTLSEYYAPELGEPFVSAGLCLYRDGRDSVAWHGDRIGAGRDRDTMVAIVSVGASRELQLRPRSGGQSLRFAAGHGDLLVMGGSCQRTWDHAVPKTAKPVGPRISIQFRVRGAA